MNKLCKQLSIESPGVVTQECVFNTTVQVPEIPPNGALIKVICAGACYRMQKTPSLINTPESPITCCGFRDGALFPGYEVSGIVEALGSESSNPEIQIGSRVVVYPYEDVPNGYPEFMVVPDLKYLIPIPNSMSLSVAAMLPTGALLAKNAILKVKEHYDEHERSKSGRVFKVLIVGTGGLALWAVKIAEYYFKSPEYKDKIQITVACLNDEGFYLNELKKVNLVQWNEEIFEEVLHERTLNACNGLVDVVIDFGTTSRSLLRSLQCLNRRGVVYVTHEVAESLLPKFWKILKEDQLFVCPIDDGTLSQLKDLIQTVARHDIIPPSHTEFPADAASIVVKKLSQSEIQGRAILRFHYDSQ
ncbi:uncharacterized protein [Onthophagus taurus]|uniref:uncharacterized protein n=1 Tax=Onthophagus taurus TaxID=166361 RepID=UPI0039BE9415